MRRKRKRRSSFEQSKPVRQSDPEDNGQDFFIVSSQQERAMLIEVFWKRIKLSSAEDPLDHPKELQPCISLLTAILERALRDVMIDEDTLFPSERVKIKHIRKNAVKWLYNDGNHTWSYCWICDWLEIDHLRLRRRVEDRTSLAA